MASILLIDGSSYLYRAFHAIPHLTAPDGTPTNALYGFINMIKSLREKTPADYIACVFDAKGKTFRDAIYPDYKANRHAMPEALCVQIEPIHTVLKALGIPILMLEGVEADDVIGTLALQASQLGIETILSTSDKDMAQLVNVQVRIENSMNGGETLDREGVFTKFGVYPEQIVDYFSLVGDTVDNVPGIPQCGPKTAQKWLAQYRTLDKLVQHAHEVKGVVGQNLRNGLDWLPIAQTLIMIKCDVDLREVLPHGFDSLKPKCPDWPALLVLFTRYAFRSWTREVQVKLQNAAQHNIENNTNISTSIPTSKQHHEAILTESQLLFWIDQLQKAQLTSIDTETTSLDPMTARIVGISFSTEVGIAAYLPLGHLGLNGSVQIPLQYALEKLKPWLESTAHKKLGQNTKYDQHVFANHGIQLAGIVDDTMLMSYVLESDKRHNLDDMAMRYLGRTTLHYEDLCGKGAKQINFNQVTIEAATPYAAQNADITLELGEKFRTQLTHYPRLRSLYQEIEMPTREILLEMERHGVLLDTQKLIQQSKELGLRLIEIEKTAYELAKQPFNLNSPKQVANLLFEQLKLPVVRKTAKGEPSTDEAVLQELACDFPLPKILLEHRTLAKLKSTYTDKLPFMVNKITGRVHTHFSQATVVTGRLASDSPNLQNIPIRTAEGRRVRAAFVAPPGYKLVSADYSQIELRIMAHLSGDPALLSAFSQGVDIHRATASEVFGCSQEEVTHEQRRYAKAVNFGLIYGMSAFGLAKQLEIERSAAQTYIDRYFSRFPGVAAYMERTRQEAHEKGYVETYFGRRLWLRDIQSPNMARRTGAERAAINAPMQGTAADLIKLAMVNVVHWLKDQDLRTRLILQVHDELVLEVPNEELDQIKVELPQRMASVAQLDVPLLTEVGIGKNWDEAH